jgi:hypothetical protein
VLVVQGRAQDTTVIQSRMAARFWGGARGWNADQFGRQLLLPPVRPAEAGVERGGGGGPVVGTLLGPERADRARATGWGSFLLWSGPVCFSYHHALRGCGFGGAG